MNVDLVRSPLYFMYPYEGYYQSPNQFHFGLYLRKYQTTLGGLLKPFKSSSAGYKWNYAKNESLYYFAQQFKSLHGVRTIY